MLKAKSSYVSLTDTLFFHYIYEYIIPYSHLVATVLLIVSLTLNQSASINWKIRFLIASGYLVTVLPSYYTMITKHQIKIMILIKVNHVVIGMSPYYNPFSENEKCSRHFLTRRMLTLNSN